MLSCSPPTPDWLSLYSSIPSLFQSVVGDSRRINRAPSLKALFMLPGVPCQERPGEVPGLFVALAWGSHYLGLLHPSRISPLTGLYAFISSSLKWGVVIIPTSQGYGED